MSFPFDLIKSPKVRTLLEKEGYSTPTEAQRVGIPAIQGGEHVLLMAPTGMGKTESALLPLFDRILQEGAHPGVRILYVTPLRALNRDLLSRLESWGEVLGVTLAVRHGDTPPSERSRQSSHPPTLLITTPETLQAMFLGHRLREALSRVRAVVVDEIHELASDERGAQLAVALERLSRFAGEFQRVGLSATVGSPTKVARFLGGASRPVRVVVATTPKPMEVRVVAPSPTQEDRRRAGDLATPPEVVASVRAVLEECSRAGSTLVFTNTREAAEHLGVRASILDPHFPLSVHHGSLSRESRIEAEESFKEGRIRALIATSSLELGLDIGRADRVVQYGSPREAVRLIQRVGRAGHRAGEVSRGVVVALEPDEIAESAVLVWRAKRSLLEETPLPHLPLDVLAHQLVALAIERGRVSLREAWEIFHSAAPFSDVTLADLRRVAQLLVSLRLLGLDSSKEEIWPSSRARLHFVENLSMIPDTKVFRVVGIATRRTLATLDESFVSEFLEPSATFVLQGRVWRVIEIPEGKEEILVEPARDPLGAVPAWIGEEIPVPFEIAQDVGALRRKVEEVLSQGGPKEAQKWLLQEYDLDPDGALRLVEYVRSQEGFVLPTDRTVTLEGGGGLAIVNLCGGHRVNETIGRALSALLTSRYGSTVGLEVDPYRIVLTLPTRAPLSAVEEALKGLPPEGLLTLLEKILPSSSSFRARFVQVARRFGAIEKGADLREVGISKIVEAFRPTPLFQETLRELLTERLDVELSSRVLLDLQEGKIALVVQGLSPVGRARIDFKRDQISPSRAHEGLLLAFQERLRDEKVLLLCLGCREFSEVTRVRRARRACPRCGGLLSPTRPWRSKAIQAWKKKGKLTAEEEEEVRKLGLSSTLYQEHGERALLALSARGVGPEGAARILARMRVDEERFLRDLFEAEVTYARTRPYWS